SATGEGSPGVIVSGVVDDAGLGNADLLRAVAVKENVHNAGGGSAHAQMQKARSSFLGAGHGLEDRQRVAACQQQRRFLPARDEFLRVVRMSAKSGTQLGGYLVVRKAQIGRLESLLQHGR